MKYILLIPWAAIFPIFHVYEWVAGENIVTNNNLGKNNLSITPYAQTTW